MVHHQVILPPRFICIINRFLVSSFNILKFVLIFIIQKGSLSIVYKYHLYMSWKSVTYVTIMQNAPWQFGHSVFSYTKLEVGAI